jgi:serine/threonine protein kinase
MDTGPTSHAAQTPLGACLTEICAGMPVEVDAIPLSVEFLGRYAIEKVLATGGMGVVLLGRHRGLGRPVALKFLATDSSEMRARFLREATVLVSVSHPNVLRLLDHGEEGGMPYHAVEFLSGGTLAGRIAHRLRLAPVESIDVALQVLAGLAACHQMGVIHRDLKPENVLFGDDGTVRIADLGIAHDPQAAGVLTRTGMLLGTPRYMAPEQARGELVTASADLYAVGALLYHMLTGQPPFTSTDPVQVLRKQILEAPQPVEQLVHGLPRGLGELVDRALAKLPGERPASAVAFAEALAAIRSGFASDGTPRVIEISAPPSHAARPSVGGARRRKRAALAITIAVTPLFVAAIALLVRPVPVRRTSPSPGPSALASVREEGAVDPEAALREEARALDARLAAKKAESPAAQDERKALERRFLARARAVLGPRCGGVLTPLLARELVEDVWMRTTELRNTYESSAYNLLMDGRAPQGVGSGEWVARQTEDFEAISRDLRDLAPAAFRREAEAVMKVRFAMTASLPMRPSFHILDARVRERFEQEARRWLRERADSWIPWEVESERHAHAHTLEEAADARWRAIVLLEEEIVRRGRPWENHLTSHWLDLVGRQAHALIKRRDRERATALRDRLAAIQKVMHDQPEPVRNAIATQVENLERFYK